LALVESFFISALVVMLIMVRASIMVNTFFIVFTYLC